MGDRGRRRSSGGSGKSRTTNQGRSSRSNAKSASSSSNRRRRSSLFVEGGILSDFRRDSTPFSPSRGGNSQRKGSKHGTSDRAKASASTTTGPRNCNSNAFGYQYPSMDVQGLEGESGNAGNYSCDKLDESNPMVLVESKENKIVAYLDRGPSSSSKDIDVNYAYEYNTPGFVLGDGSHRGLGFCDESDAGQSGTVSTSKPSGDQAGSSFASLPTEEVDAEEESDDEVNLSEDEVTPNVVKPSRRNSGFISIGGMKLYTEDISDEESDGEEGILDGDDVASGDEESTESSDQGGQSESSATDSSKDMFGSDSDIVEDVAEDYLEGIGGSEKVLDARWLAEQSLDQLDLSDDESSSEGSSDESTEKLSDIALQNASREYGMKESARSHSSRHGRDSRALPFDDLMFVKDPRSLSGKKTKKIHSATFPQSWPSYAQKSKNSRRFPGEKKKHRKEMIAVKRRERMLQRGVDLAQINSKLEQIVAEGVDMHCFQRMHHRDCSQVRRLADVYRLSSSCNGSGKKSFVMVTRTYQTCLPSASDKLRIEKLIGAGDDDFDFAVNVGGANAKSACGNGKKTKDSGKKQNIGQSRRKIPLADQPVSFVSSGVINSETVGTEASREKDPKQVVAEPSGASSAANFGAFEVHTKGFGSKMMAKMGYIEGAGLGKDGKGLAQPIEVVQRPKSLGLGLDFSPSVEENQPSSSSGSGRRKGNSSGKDPKHEKGVSGSSRSGGGGGGGKGFGAFEQHTKGFGSRMMAKMGFVEGTGLGRDSQGMTNPLFAVRRPKARGLGAEGKGSKVSNKSGK
ncbi:PREDICTED: uncharacterized protein LOC104815398 [Tarenaya hassleriana]|uniref:uncharacterized protein LOC104815398 n=1 Tax=Tarenaya hassleriana TaxID=28532 RepID=UPI00053C6847|nr:PREDICTED: uncharacterized protein LOC104815398 [Tarenaya hassleriana]